MSDTIFVVPANAGSQLEHPVSGALPDAGAAWLADQFTFRLIQDGDIKRGPLPGAALLAPTPAPEPEKDGK